MLGLLFHSKNTAGGTMNDEARWCAVAAPD